MTSGGTIPDRGLFGVFLVGEKASRVVPYTTMAPFGSDNPRDLWKWMSAYEQKTGGHVLAIAHNGNLINADVLRDELERKGSIFQTTADSEIILHLLAQPSNNGVSILTALRRIEGAFSLLIMSEQELIAVRDPFGWRPLVLGKLDGAYILASETCALDLIHAKFEREIKPGEVLIIDENGTRSEWPFPAEQPAFCMFEYVYFARPDSIIGGVNVGKVRIEMGRELDALLVLRAEIGSRPRHRQQRADLDDLVFRARSRREHRRERDEEPAEEDRPLERPPQRGDGPRLADAALVAKTNGDLIDLTRPLEKVTSFEGYVMLGGK